MDACFWSSDSFRWNIPLFVVAVVVVLVVVAIICNTTDGVATLALVIVTIGDGSCGGVDNTNDGTVVMVVVMVVATRGCSRKVRLDGDSEIEKDRRFFLLSFWGTGDDDASRRRRQRIKTTWRGCGHDTMICDNQES